jgi:dTDP-4-amino-4,6-dideoxygalactose transaminase
MKVLFASENHLLNRYVIVPSYTFAATVTSITNIGFLPIYVDVDVTDWHMSPEHLEELLKEHGQSVIGILACSTFGTLPPIEKLIKWKAIAKKYGKPLALDSAAGYGNDIEATYHEYEYADAVVYSMHATKTFAVGEGGVIFANADVIKECKKLSQFGFDESRIALPNGTNAKISEIHCAFGLAALDTIEDHILQRRANASRYIKLLGESQFFSFQLNSNTSTWQSIFLQIDPPPKKLRILDSLDQNKIQYREDWSKTLHSMIPSVLGSDLRVTEKLAIGCLSLPNWIGLKDSQIDQICEHLLRSCDI